MNSLITRARIKKGKPVFRRSASGKKLKISDAWRAKKTKQNKIGRKGHLRAISLGYKSPADIRGTTPQGHFPIIVTNQEELLKVDTKKQCAVIGRTVGNRRRIELLKIAQEKKILVFNFKNPQATVEKLTKAQADLSAKKKEAEKKKEAQKPVKTKQEKTEAEQKDELEKKQEGIKQQEKQITKKQ